MKSKLHIGFNLPLNTQDTESITYGCRANNPEICRFYMLDGVCASVIVIKSERNILPYLFWNLVNRYDELRAISDSSSIRGSLTTKMIAAFEIPLANEQSLQAFADFAWSVIPQIENNLLENERLTALRDSLLPKLMSGEIDVTDIQL